MTTHSIALYFVVSIPLVFGQDNPCPLCDKRQPYFVQRSTWVKISMALELHTSSH